MLTHFGQDIWIADGAEIDVAGFRYVTRMAVIRLADGGLFVWSPIALTESLRGEVEALGEVRCIVAPNTLHHLYFADWAAAFPQARLYAAPGLAAKRKDIAFDEDLTDAPPADWSGQIDQAVIGGNLIATEVAFFHAASRTAIFTDLIQQHDPARYSGWRALVAKLDLMTAGEPAVPRKFRVAFTRRRAARAAVEKTLAWPADNLLMAHGQPVRGDGAAALRRAFAWLTG